MRFWVILIELVLLVLIGLLIRRVVKKYTHIGLMWSGVCFAGFAVAGFSGAKSTAPSSAPRVTVTGLAQGCIEHRIGRGNYTYSFSISPAGGSPVQLTSRIKAPFCWTGTASDFDARVYRVVYLDDSNRNLKNEAIRIDVIGGQNTGWHGSVDARPFGLWLGIPGGIACIIIGGIGAFRNRKALPDDSSAANRGHGPLKDDQSALTDLKL